MSFFCKCDMATSNFSESYVNELMIYIDIYYYNILIVFVSSQIDFQLIQVIFP